MLNQYRDIGKKVLNPISDFLVKHKVQPNYLSVFSLISAILAAFFYIKLFVIYSALLIFLNALFDALDGEVARKQGLEDRKGDFVDHLIDRYSDVFIFSGIAFSLYVPIWLGLIAIIGVLLTSYLGTQAQAIDVGRVYSGFLGRADRLVLLIISSIFLALTPTEYLGFNIMEWTFIIIAILSNLTVLQRFLYVWKKLG
ncbi:CDP-alcohol phosphatidyltransferase family protein [archaeon SCG-AAA382B04]|nr:CDP-alcohol phosphatidyltransferase family protein [archaeon SCG-AAA382B04]